MSTNQPSTVRGKQQRQGALAWSLQRRVNRWFLENSNALHSRDLTNLTDKTAMLAALPLASDPDRFWYQNDGATGANRERLAASESVSYWEAIAPLYDFLHREYNYAWTYSVLMMQSSEDFEGTPSNLGVGDHFTGREEVVFENGMRSKPRAGWHVNQLPPFLVQQAAASEPPFELISTYAINIRHLTDGLPFTLRKGKSDSRPQSDQRRIISIHPLEKAIEGVLPECISILEEASIDSYSAAQGWGRGGLRGLLPVFAEVDKILQSALRSDVACRIRAANNGELLHVLNGGPDAKVVPSLLAQLSRPENTYLAVAKYLVLMNTVWPEWTDITMIPHPVPILTHPQPGGIVLCRDSRSARVSSSELCEIGDLLSVCIWPWISLQQGARRAEESARRAALLGNVVRHDLFNGLANVRVILENPELRSPLLSEERCAQILSRLNLLYWSVSGLSGLESPYNEENLVEVRKMLGDLQESVAAHLSSQFDLYVDEGLGGRVSIVYYSVLAEFIRNALKRRPKDWPSGKRHIEVVVSANGDDLRVTVSNPADREHAEEALRIIRTCEAELAQGDWSLRREEHQQGLELIVNIVHHLSGRVLGTFEERKSGQIWLDVSLEINNATRYWAD